MSGENTGPYRGDGETVYATNPEQGSIKDIDSDTPRYQQRQWLMTQYHTFNKSQSEIADICGVNQMTISRWMDKLNINARDSADGASLAQTDAEKLLNEDWLRSQYVEEELSSHQIAEKLEVSNDAVLRALKRADIPIRSRTKAHKAQWDREYGHKKYRDEEWLKNQYIYMGKTQSEIAEKCDTVQSTIQRWLKKFNIPTRSKSAANYLKWKQEHGIPFRDERKLVTSEGIDASWRDLSDLQRGRIVQYRDRELLESLIDEGKTMDEIADEFGVGYTTINRWIHKFGLKTEGME